MSDYLYHHGILGQRWGIRRFQDKNGKYTQAGKKRYGIKEQEKFAKKIKKDLSKKGFHESITLKTLKKYKGDENVRSALKKYKSAKARKGDAGWKVLMTYHTEREKIRDEVDKEMKKDGVNPRNKKLREKYEDKRLDPILKKLRAESDKAAEDVRRSEKQICDVLLGKYGKQEVKTHYGSSLETSSGLRLHLDELYSKKQI